LPAKTRHSLSGSSAAFSSAHNPRWTPNIGSRLRDSSIKGQARHRVMGCLSLGLREVPGVSPSPCNGGTVSITHDSSLKTHLLGDPRPRRPSCGEVVGRLDAEGGEKARLCGPPRPHGQLVSRVGLRAYAITVMYSSADDRAFDPMHKSAVLHDHPSGWGWSGPPKAPFKGAHHLRAAGSAPPPALEPAQTVPLGSEA
jgi:hypothetical protein